MKRFYVALILLTVIIFSSIILNNILENKADELIKIAVSSNEENIILWWEENGKWFDALLHDDLTNLIYLNIEKMKEQDNDENYVANIITGAQKIKDSISLTPENIF